MNRSIIRASPRTQRIYGRLCGVMPRYEVTKVQSACQSVSATRSFDSSRRRCNLLTRRSIEKTFHARALYRCVIACVDIEDMPIASRGNCASNGMVAHVVCITDRHKYCKTSDPIVSHDTWICFSHSSLDVLKHTQWAKRMQIH